MGGKRLPVTEGARQALDAFYERLAQGKVPKRRRYARVIGGIVGSHQHQRRKRNQQRRNAYNWTYRHGT